MRNDVATPESGAPTVEFWANDLEFDSTRAKHTVAGKEALCAWVDELSGQQIRVLCLLLGLNHEDLVQKLRPTLKEHTDAFTPFHLVKEFGKGKSEVAVIEVAREALSPHLLDLCVMPRRKGCDVREGHGTRYPGEEVRQ